MMNVSIEVEKAAEMILSGVPLNVTTVPRKLKTIILKVEAEGPTVLKRWKKTHCMFPPRMVICGKLCDAYWLCDLLSVNRRTVLCRVSLANDPTTCSGWAVTPMMSLRVAYHAATGKDLCPTKSATGTFGYVYPAMQSLIYRCCRMAVPENLRVAVVQHADFTPPPGVMEHPYLKCTREELVRGMSDVQVIPRLRRGCNGKVPPVYPSSSSAAGQDEDEGFTARATPWSSEEEEEEEESLFVWNGPSKIVQSDGTEVIVNKLQEMTKGEYERLKNKQ
jgi:hypothetical protein